LHKERLNEEQPFVSVIVPIYNVERYLSNCLDSIKNQSYPNLEIILIDDGSTDSSREIAENFVKAEKRAKIFHIKNSGMAEARNVGIKYVTSPYITFVDSDDALSTFFVENHLFALLSTGAKMSKGRFATRQKKLDHKKAGSWEVGTGSKAVGINSTDYGGTVSVWGNIYCSDLFLKTNIRYPKGMYYEDFAIFFPLVHEAKQIVFLQEKVYYYRQRFNSIMSQRFNLKMLDYFEIVDNVRLFFKNYYPSQINCLDRKEIIDYLGFANKISIFSKNAKYRKLYVERLEKAASQTSVLNPFFQFLFKSRKRIEYYLIFRYLILRVYFWVKKGRILLEEAYLIKFKNF